MADTDDLRARAEAAEASLDGMRGERDAEREISQAWERRVETAEAEVARLTAVLGDVGSGDGSIRRADLVYTRGYRKGRAEAEASAEAEVARLRAIVAAADRMHGDVRDAVDRLVWIDVGEALHAYDAARGPR